MQTPGKGYWAKLFKGIKGAVGTWSKHRQPRFLAQSLCSQDLMWLIQMSTLSFLISPKKLQLSYLHIVSKQIHLLTRVIRQSQISVKATIWSQLSASFPSPGWDRNSPGLLLVKDSGGCPSLLQNHWPQVKPGKQRALFPPRDRTSHFRSKVTPLKSELRGLFV